MIFLRKYAAVIIVVASLAVIVIGILIASHSTSPKPSDQPSSPSVAAPVTVIQPPSAKDVANSLGCKNFKDLGSAPDVGVVDSGSCWIGGTKYAINTFVSSAVRDSWLTAAEQLGVVPKWETNTSVTYPSVSS